MLDTTTGMQYLVHRAAGNLGPFSLEELRQQVAAGSVKPDDLAWHEGLPQWQPVSTLIPAAGPAGFPTSYVPPTLAASAGSAAEVRRTYFPHEQNVRSIGTYFYFTGGLQLFCAVVIFLCGALSSFAGKGLGTNAVPFIAVSIEAIVFFILGGLTVWGGSLFRKLDRRAFLVGVIVAAIGLIGIPVGTLISGFILYLILCDKGRFVLSDDYRAIVAATPEFQWKTALWVKIIIGLLILAFVLVVAISILLALGQTVHQIEQTTH